MLETIAVYVIFGGFGLWWALFPNSVIRFYKWFHNGKVKMASPKAIRIIGIIWTVFFIVLSNFSKK